jgi:hypothetical protein
MQAEQSKLELSNSAITLPPTQNTSLLDYYSARRNYDEFASNSLSKAKKLYEQFYKRYKYLENLGYKAPKPPLLSVFDFLNEEKIQLHETEIESLKQNLPDDIKSQILTLDEIKEEIKLNAKNAESLLKELERSTSFAKKISADIAASAVNVINDPIQWLTLFIPTPTKFIPGVATDAALSGITEGFINHYFLNPRKKELELDQINLKQAIIEGSIGGGVASGLFRGIGKLADKFLLKDSDKKAQNFVIDRILNDPIADKTTKDLIDVANNKNNFEKLSEIGEKELSNLEKHLDRELDLEKNLDKELDLKEDLDKEFEPSLKDDIKSNDLEPSKTGELDKVSENTTDLSKDSTLSTGSPLSRGQESEIDAIIPKLKEKINLTEDTRLKSEEKIKLKIAQYLKKHENSYSISKTKDPIRAFRFYLDEYPIEAQRYTGTMEYFLDDFYSKFTSKELKNNPDLNINFIKEIYDIDTKDKIAKELKSVFKNKINYFVTEELKDLGVDITPLKNYFPQNHNKRLLTSAGQENWVNFTHNLLDWEKIEKQTAKKVFDENISSVDSSYKKNISPLSHKKISEEEFIQNFKIDDKKDFLNQIYDLIISDGATNINLDKHTIKSPLYKKLLKERTLHFKNADSFYNYQKEFSNNENTIDAITSYIDRFSKNLATLKSFGPNPRSTFDWTKKLLLKNSKKNVNFSLIDSAFEKITNPSTFIADTAIGNIYTSFYSLRSSALLSGSSILAYITDPITSALTSSYNGLNTIRTILKKLYTRTWNIKGIGKKNRSYNRALQQHRSRKSEI